MINLEKLASVGSNISNIFAGVTAVIALTLGYLQYKEISESQRDAETVRLYLSYVEIQKEAAMTNLSKWHDSHFYYGSYTVVVAETIFLIQRENEGWVNTVRWMIENHKEYFSHIKCGVLNEQFTRLVSDVLEKNICQKNALQLPKKAP